MTPPAITLPDDLPEAAFTTWVIDLAKLHGWSVCHFRPARTAAGWRTALTGDPGAPDLILARGGDVLLVELKTNAGRVRPDQRRWLDQLGDRGVVWRPRDADQVLDRVSRPGAAP